MRVTSESRHAHIPELVYELQNHLVVPQQAGPQACRRVEGEVAEDQRRLLLGARLLQLRPQPIDLSGTEPPAELDEAALRLGQVRRSRRVVLVLLIDRRSRLLHSSARVRASEVSGVRVASEVSEIQKRCCIPIAGALLTKLLQTSVESVGGGIRLSW